MSIVQLRIELPTYAHSFSIHVPDTCTILEVKKEISRICPGQPCVDGQKLIWRGRFLTDNEQVDTIWKVSVLWVEILLQCTYPDFFLVSKRTAHRPSFSASFLLDFWTANSTIK